MTCSESGATPSRRIRSNSVLDALKREDHPRSVPAQVLLLAYRQLLKFSKMVSQSVSQSASH
jgi:hypothetical protein